MKKNYYLGPTGSYSYLIAKKIFPDDELVSCESFFPIVNKILKDKDALGVLPIENSTTSDVFENVDYLFSKNFTIVEEAYFKINLYLVGLKNSSLEQIKEVYSHPKALAQSSKYIEKHHLTMCESKSTAHGKDIVLAGNDIKKAFIGSRDLARDPRLLILSENIGNARNNMTRFVVIKKFNKDEIEAKSNQKLTIIFKLLHKPGTLANLLTKLTELKVNLTKIESRPIPGSQWEYYFLVDLEINPEDIKTVEKIFTANTLMAKKIGVYEKGKIYES